MNLTRLIFRGGFAVLVLCAQPSSIPALQAIELHTECQCKPEVSRSSDPFTLDGHLDETLWQHATLVSKLHQVYPKEFGNVEQPTKVYLVQTEQGLLIGAELIDNDINNLKHFTLAKGQDFGTDDLFGIVIDPFNQGRSGYLFVVNPNGFKEDFLTTNDTMLDDWDGNWQAAAVIAKDKWVVEIFIPFSTLSYPGEPADWGMNFLRELKSPDSTLYWSSKGYRPSLWSPQFASPVSGLIPAKAEQTLEAKMSLTSSRSKEPTSSSSQHKPSLDLVYKPSAGNTTALSFNTDFSATEIDEQQVNLSRFSLFLPEKRNFFLHDANIFEFGGLGSNGRPFFSRQMGLSDSGTPLDIHWGLKTSGQWQNHQYGAIVLEQDHQGKSQRLAVARVNSSLSENFTLGGIATKGSPYPSANNQLIGFDSNYFNTQWLDGEKVEFKLWYQQSDDEFSGIQRSDKAYGAAVLLPNETLNAKLGFTHIGDDFKPGLGFINRAGIKQLDGWLSVSNSYKPNVLKDLYHTFYFEQTSDLAGNSLSQVITTDLFELRTQGNLSLRLGYDHFEETIVHPFTLIKQWEIEAADYQFSHWRVSANTDQSQKAFISASIESGTYFDAPMRYQSILGQWNITPNLQWQLSLGHREFDTKQEQIRVKTYSTKLSWSLSTKLYWNHWLQFDNVSDSLSWYSKLHWKLNDSAQISLVLNRLYLDEANKGFALESQEQLMKAEYRMTF